MVTEPQDGAGPGAGRPARPASGGPIRGVIFDKDGTLFDFHATWSHWTAALLARLAAEDATLMRRLGEAIGYDTQRRVFAPNSPVVAETVDRIAARLVPLLPNWDAATLEREMVLLATTAPQVEATPLAGLLDTLSRAGIRLGVATNDGEVAALAQLERAGIRDRFCFVAGYDSGHGGKPGPGPLLAFARAAGLVPGQVAMIGDSLHDLEAAHAAGMVALGVLTGPAARATLAPLADAVLDDISGLPDWLRARDAGAAT